MKKAKYALLDTDFISKTYSIRKDEHNRMIDRISLEFAARNGTAVLLAITGEAAESEQ